MEITLVIVIFITVLAVFLYLQNNIIDITKYSIKSDSVNGRFKIVQLSDLHSRPFKKILKKLDEIHPDIIVITGDYINDKGKNIDKMIDFAGELVSRAPVYYITGNHERRLKNFDSVMQNLKDAGFIVLLDDIAQVDVNGSNISLLGLDENMADFSDYKARRNGTFEYRDMSGYFEKLSKNQGFKIVLSHFPENFEKINELYYAQYDFDLQLSGHAHGGQFILPIIGPVFSPGQGIFPKYARGSFGERPMLIVSRGLGNAEFPFRLFNHPEINVITVSPKIK